MNLHKGVVLDWGASGAAGKAKVALITAPDGGKITEAKKESSIRFSNGLIDDDRYLEDDAVNVGVTGEEAMAQALIGRRSEQAILENRARANEQRLEQFRSEALHLRAVLERWHAEFVLPAMQIRRRKPEVRERATADVGKDFFERKLLVATAGLLGARDEAVGLRENIAALQALVARLRDDEVCVR